MERGGCVYIITNKNKTVLYIGVTSDLRNRIEEHRQKKYPNSFSAKYNCEILIWYELFGSIEEAILYEKYFKGKKRDFKLELINKMNPEWKDLWNDVKDW